MVRLPFLLSTVNDAEDLAYVVPALLFGEDFRFAITNSIAINRLLIIGGPSRTFA